MIIISFTFSDYILHIYALQNAQGWILYFTFLCLGKKCGLKLLYQPQEPLIWQIVRRSKIPQIAGTLTRNCYCILKSVRTLQTSWMTDFLCFTLKVQKNRTEPVTCPPCTTDKVI